jgi:SlyX protein
MKDLENRITDLEIKYSYQDDLVNELNQIVAKQAQMIKKLEKDLKEMATLSNDKSSHSANSADEVPPHY